MKWVSLTCFVLQWGLVQHAWSRPKFPSSNVVGGAKFGWHPCSLWQDFHCVLTCSQSLKQSWEKYCMHVFGRELQWKQESVLWLEALRPQISGSTCSFSGLTASLSKQCRPTVQQACVYTKRSGEKNEKNVRWLAWLLLI